MSLLRTGNSRHESYLELHRRLLSEYNPDLGLGKYVAYSEFNALGKKAAALIDARKKVVIEEMEAEFAKTNAETTGDNKTPKPELIESEKIMKISLALDKDEEVQKAHDAAFELFKVSFDNVKAYLREADSKIIREAEALKAETQDQIRETGEERLVTMYADVQEVMDYRTLNCDLFGRALNKYFVNCAMDSLLVQRKVQYCDERVSKSCIALPTFDIDEKKAFITSALAVAFNRSFEVAQDRLQKAAYKQRLHNRTRLVDIANTHFYTKRTAFKTVGHKSFKRKVLSGSTSTVISKFVSDLLRTDLVDSSIGAFANGEVSIKVHEAVRGNDVFVVQSFTKTQVASLSTVIMELFLLFQTLQLASAGRATAVLPFIAYTNKTNEVSAMAEMLQLMGCAQVITVDMFNEQVEGFFDKSPVENLPAKMEFVRYVSQQLRREGHNCKDIVIVAGDSHNVARARSFADALSEAVGGEYVGLATAVRRVRSVATDDGQGAFLNEVYLTGDVDGKMCIILDCILDEGVNLVTIANHLVNSGAQRVKAVITHALFSGDCAKRVVDSALEEIIVSDSVNQDEHLINPPLAKKLRVITLAPLIAEAIDRIHTENTLSTLFDGRK